MLNLLSAFAEFVPELEEQDLQVDGEFITDFLQPYFDQLPREELAAKVAEIIACEQERTGPRNRAR